MSFVKKKFFGMLNKALKIITSLLVEGDLAANFSYQDKTWAEFSTLEVAI